MASQLSNSPVGGINQHFNLPSGLSLFSPPPHWRPVVEVRLLLSPLTPLSFGWLSPPGWKGEVEEVGEAGWATTLAPKSQLLNIRKVISWLLNC